jgi:hypothetical protein
MFLGSRHAAAVGCSGSAGAGGVSIFDIVDRNIERTRTTHRAAATESGRTRGDTQRTSTLFCRSGGAADHASPRFARAAGSRHRSFERPPPLGMGSIEPLLRAPRQLPPSQRHGSSHA